MVVFFHHFLVAPVCRAGWIGQVVALDEHDRAPEVEVVGLLALSQAFVPRLLDGAELMRFERSSTTTTHACHRAVVALELSMRALLVEPASKLVRLGNVGLHHHRRGRDHGEGATAKVAHFDTAERNNRLVHVGELLGLLAPQGETDGEACLVNDAQLSLGQLTLRSFGGDAAQL